MSFKEQTVHLSNTNLSLAEDKLYLYVLFI